MRIRWACGVSDDTHPPSARTRRRRYRVQAAAEAFFPGGLRLPVPLRARARSACDIGAALAADAAPPVTPEEPGAAERGVPAAELPVAPAPLEAAASPSVFGAELAADRIEEPTRVVPLAGDGEPEVARPESTADGADGAALDTVRELTEGTVTVDEVTDGTLATGVETFGVITVGVVTFGVVTVSVVTFGVVTVGVVTFGVVTVGVVTFGVVTVGAVPTGVDTDGTVTDGTVTWGMLTEGALTAGALTAGALTAGTLTDGAGALTAGTLTAGAVTAGTLTDGTGALTEGAVTDEVDGST